MDNNSSTEPKGLSTKTHQALIHIPSEIYFSNLLGSAAKPEPGETLRGPTRRLARQLDEAEGSARADALAPHLEASFCPLSKPRPLPARLFISGPTQSERGKMSTDALVHRRASSADGPWLKACKEHTGRPRSLWKSPLSDKNYSLACFPFRFYQKMQTALLPGRAAVAAARYCLHVSWGASCICEQHFTQKYRGKGREHTHTTHNYLQKPVKSLLAAELSPAIKELYKNHNFIGCHTNWMAKQAWRNIHYTWAEFQSNLGPKGSKSV